MSRTPFTTSAELEANCAAIDALGVGASGTAQELVDVAIESATELMWHLTGRQFGEETTKLRPTPAAGTTELDLGVYPVTAILSVKIDGATLPTSAYWVSGDRYLLRTDGAAWPTDQKPYLEDTLPETFSVTFTWGTPAPPAVRSGTRRLACELLALSLQQPSALSERVRSVTRQGTNFDVVSADDLLNNNGRTGIFEVDLAISSYNSGGNAAPPLILTPEDFDGTRSSTGRGAVQGEKGDKGDKGDTGDTGPPGPGAWTTVLDTTLTGTASSISITGLGAYSRFRFRLIGRSSSTTVGYTDLRMRFNDTGFNYAYVQDGGANTGNTYVAKNEGVNSTTYIKVGLVTASQTNTNRYGVVDAETHFVSGFGPGAIVKGDSFVTTSNILENLLTHHGGVWRNPTALTALPDVSLFLGDGSFVAGTRLLVEVPST